MVIPPITTAPEPIEAPRHTRVGMHFQSASLCNFPSVVARVQVVDEHHAVTDEHFILDRHPFANERVARNLAVRANHRVFLNLHERPDARIVADAAAIQIDEGIYPDVPS